MIFSKSKLLILLKFILKSETETNFRCCIHNFVKNLFCVLLQTVVTYIVFTVQHRIQVYFRGGVAFSEKYCYRYGYNIFLREISSPGSNMHKIHNYFKTKKKI